MSVTSLLLLGALDGLLLSLALWRFQRRRPRWDDEVLMERRDDMLVWLLAFAAFVLGVFVTYLWLWFDF